ETPFDLVVSDLSFDGTERLDFVEAVRRSQGSPAVVLVTAYPTLESAIGALDLGLAAYLVKPVEFHTMHARAQLLLDWRASIQRTRLTLEQLNAALPQMADLGTRVATGAAPTRLPEEKLSEAGLTRRETELVAALLEGYRVSTVARRLGISENTVRRHLKSIFLKLEVRSQAELLEKLKP
ncbi:MAG: LuxR C-terminal-related transcriptional regulator, partial [Myxococcota bacterium]